jgi:PAS domain S-box-containing protein
MSESPTAASGDAESRILQLQRRVREQLEGAGAPAALETVQELVEMARHALREQDERLRTVLDSAKLGDWDYNVLTSEINWSPRSLELFCLPQGSSYADFLEALHPEDRERVNASVETALGTSGHYSEEYRVRQSGGGYRWVASMGRGFYDDQGNIRAMRGIAFDISERKAADARLRESEALAASQAEDLDRKEERFRFLAESLPAKIFTTDSAGEITYLNEQWATYTGQPLEVVRRLGWREFVHPHDTEEKERVWKAAVENGTSFEFEHRFQRADGQYRWHLSRAQPMRTASGRITAWIGANMDVHDLKQAQVAQQESESRARLAVEASGMGFWDWQLGQSIHWSPEHNRIMGLDPQQTEGTYELFLERVHPEDRAMLVSRVEQSELTGQDFEAEFRAIWPDGSLHWVAGHGRPFFSGGEPRTVRIIGVVRDITERKNFEDLLGRRQEELRAALDGAEHARDEAEAANRAKDHFLAVLSHELRTPLTPVLMAASTMLYDPDLTEENRDTLEMIRRNIQIEARLINDLLDLTRITRNRVDLERVPLDLHQVLHQALGVCRSELEAKPLHLELELRAENHRVNGDPARLQQVFWNLVKNAVKFTPAHGRLWVRTEDEDGHILVKVIDSGMGISPEVLPRIFDPFEQGGESFSREYGGLGLGLPISKATIDAHEGILEAHSPGPGQGATMTVKLKCLPQDQPG